jgi:hypothetical protein
LIIQTLILWELKENAKKYIFQDPNESFSLFIPISNTRETIWRGNFPPLMDLTQKLAPGADEACWKGIILLSTPGGSVENLHALFAGRGGERE